MSARYAAAEALEREGRLRDAIAAYAALGEAGEGGGETLMRQASLRLQCGEIGEAGALFRQAAALDPADPYPPLRLGQLADGLRRHVASVGFFRQALAAAPWLDEMKVNLAAGYGRAGWRDLAAGVARTISPEVGDWWQEARTGALQHRRTLRRELLARLAARREGLLGREAAWDLARRLGELGRLRAARRLCAAMIAADPDWFWPVWLSFDLVLRAEGAQPALAYLQASGWEGRGSPEHLEVKVSGLLEAGRYADIPPAVEAEAGVERRGRVHEAMLVALYLLGRHDALKRYGVEWLERRPELGALADFLVVDHVRRTVADRAAAPAYPRPARIHLMQFWDRADIPADVAEAMGSWRRMHPDWRHTVFDAAGARRFLHERLGEDAARAFGLCHHPAMMADVFRLGFLAAAGGLYADADERCVRPLSGVLPDLGEVEILAPHSGGVPGHLDNHFLGGRSGSAVCRVVAERAVARVLRSAQAGERPDIWHTTGPGALSRGVAEHLAQGGEETRRTIVLLPALQHRALVRTDYDLAYKREPAANWRLAALG